MHILAFIAALLVLLAFLRDMGNLLSGVWIDAVAWTSAYFFAWAIAHRYWKYLSKFELRNAIGLYVLIVGWKGGVPLYVNGHEVSGMLLLMIGTSVGLMLLGAESNE